MQDDKLADLELRLVKVEIKMAEREERWDDRMDTLQDSIDQLKSAIVWAVGVFITSGIAAVGALALKLLK
jgi:hypothetical protein